MIRRVCKNGAGGLRTCMHMHIMRVRGMTSFPLNLPAVSTFDFQSRKTNSQKIVAFTCFRSRARDAASMHRAEDRVNATALSAEVHAMAVPKSDLPTQE